MLSLSHPPPESVPGHELGKSRTPQAAEANPGGAGVSTRGGCEPRVSSRRAEGDAGTSSPCHCHLPFLKLQWWILRIWKSGEQPPYFHLFLITIEIPMRAPPNMQTKLRHKTPPKNHETPLIEHLLFASHSAKSLFSFLRVVLQVGKWRLGGNSFNLPRSHSQRPSRELDSRQMPVDFQMHLLPE